MTQGFAPPSLDRLARSPWAYAIIAFAVLACALPGVFSLPVLDRDEARFAQATKQMLETGDFVTISVQDEPRNKKPIGIHWLQGATAGLTTHDEIWGFRLASSFGALLSAFAIMWGGSALLGRSAAFAGALAFGSMILASTEAMIAKTDAMLCGLTALAMAALARLYLGQGGRREALIFWGAVGAGVLVKGPITPLVAALALAVLAVWERKASWMLPLRRWTGPALAALIVAPWMIAIGIETQGRFFTEALGGDLGPKVAGGHEGHFGWPGAHALLTPILTFPATFLLIPAVALGVGALRAGRDSPEHAPLRFLLAWALPTWAMFELLPTKLPHYTLPAYPAFALLMGLALTQIGAWGAWTRRGGTALFLLGGASLTGLAAYLSTFAPGLEAEDQLRAAQVGAAGGVALVAAALALWGARQAITALMVLVLSGAVAAYALRERLLPAATELLVSAETAHALEREALTPAPGGALLVVGYRETSIVFETRTDTRLVSVEEAGAEAQAGDVAVVNQALGQDSGLPEALRRRGLAFEPAGAPVVGLNYSNGDPVVLQPGLIQTSPLSASQAAQEADDRS